MIELHYYPDNASQFPHMRCCARSAARSSLELVDRNNDAQNSAVYREAQSHGQDPGAGGRRRGHFRDRRAIGLYLADKFPRGGPCAATPGSPGPGRLLQVDGVHGLRSAGWSTAPGSMRMSSSTNRRLAPHAKSSANDRLMGIFERLARPSWARGPGCLGERFSAADLYLLVMTRWGSTLPRPVRTFPEIAAHAERVLAFGRQCGRRSWPKGVVAPFV